jgi:hypothetical protein
MEVQTMRDTTQQNSQQIKPIESSQANPNFANDDRLKHQPSVLVGTSNGLLFLDSPQQVELEGKAVNALAGTSDGLWIITDRNSLWHRQLSGQWENVVAVDDLRLNCVLPLADRVLVGTSEAHLWQLTHGNLDRINSFETVEGREEWYTPWGGQPDVRSMAVSSDGDIYVNVHVGGILRSSDQGQTWQPTIDFHTDVHEVQTIATDPAWVLAATAEGLAVSQDKGKTWSFDRANLHAAYARAVAVAEETLLLSTSTGPNGSKAAIYRRPLHQSGAFEKCTRGLPQWFSDNINTGTLATAGKVAVSGTREGQVFRSEDAGLSWQQIAANLAPISCLKLLSVERVFEKF